MNLITKLLILALLGVWFLIGRSAYAGTKVQCIEAMKLHLTWLSQNKNIRAERQLETAGRICAPHLKTEKAKKELTELTLEDAEIQGLYDATFLSTDP